MMIRSKYLLFLLALLLFIYACSDDNGDAPGNGTDETVVNNTELDPETTLYGLITDTQNNPIPNVVVTDGFTNTATDRNGVYQLVRNRRAKFVYYSTPSDYKIAIDKDNHPKFYEKFTSRDRKIRQDFTLEKQPVENTFTLFGIGDPQCRTDANVTRYKTETIEDINKLARTYQSSQNVYAITLGDIVDDAPQLWSKMKEAMSNQSIPFFQTIGNHDHLQDDGINEEAREENFQNYFGPTNYSFNRGKVHVISMDNVVYTGRQQYYGSFTESQWKWLQEDLSYVDKDMMVILCTHIPIRDGGSTSHRNTGAVEQNNGWRQEVLNLLSTFKEAHIMTGHTHYQINYLHNVNGKTIYEHVHGAACGAWWNSIWCADGTPNGYGVYEIEGNTIKNWYYKGTDQPADYQVRAYDALKEFGPAGKYTYAFAPHLNLTGEGWIVANIWNSDPNWDVRLYQDGVEIGTMTRHSSKDYKILFHHLEIQSKAIGSVFDRTSNHFYRGRVNGDASQANFRIEAKDPFGNVYTTTELTD